MNKRMIALGLALACGFTMAQAADGNQGGPNASKKGPAMTRMKKELGLTDEQVEQMREIRKEGGTREEVQAVMNPEQQAKAAELQQQHQAKRANRMKKKLGLSDEQVTQIEEIRNEGGSPEEIRAVLTPEQQTKFDQAQAKHKGKGKGKGKPPQPEE